MEHLSERFGLSKKKCLVTGATKGIGKAVAEEFCKLGAEVFVCSRNETDVLQQLTEWKNKGYQVQGCAADCSDQGQRTALTAKVKEAFGGRLDVLVNNVGTNIRKPTVEYTSEDFNTLISTNLHSAFHLCQLCQPLLAEAKGCIVFNSSVSGGPTAMKSGSIYAMTKAALNQLTRNLACEWAHLGIRANAVAPWYTATELAMQVMSDEQYAKTVMDRTPLKRMGQPEEVAATIAFLAGPSAAYITGQVLAVDGGYSVMGFY